MKNGLSIVNLKMQYKDKARKFEFDSDWVNGKITIVII